MTTIELVAYWLLFSAGCGAFEALLFHLANPVKTGLFNQKYGDIHGYFTIFRAVGFLPILFTGWGVVGLLFAVLTFPLIHDGMYYEVRHLLDERLYECGFWSNESKDTTAKISLTLEERIFTFVGGFGLLLLTL